MGAGLSVPSNFSSPKSVVIIGGGYAGQGMAILADPHFNVTVIERREHLVHKIGGVRAAVRKEWADFIVVPQNKVLKRGKWIHAAVTKVDKNSRLVYLDNGNTCHYDYLIFAMGGLNSGPVEPPAIMTANLTGFYSEVADKIQSNNTILIVGGGPVGVELCGEIISKYPNKKVTIVSSKNNLCDIPLFPPGQKFHDAIKKKLESKGVKLILGDSAKIGGDEFGGKPYLEGTRSVTLASGAVVDDVDLVFLCVGYKPNTQFLAEDPEWQGKLIENTGLINVDNNLRVVGEKNVFAIGDCHAFKEPKTLVVAGTSKGKMGFPRGNADYVMDAIYAEETGKLALLKPYVSGVKGPMMLVPIGPKDAAAVGAPGFFARAKAKAYFYDVQWKSANQNVPAAPKL